MKRNASRSNGKRPNRVMIGMAVLILMVVVGFSYRQWEQFKRANAEAAGSRGVVDAVDQLLYSLIDAETGQRGFLLTGENRYLEPYNQAVQAIPNELRTVRRLLAGRASGAGNVARLNNLVDRKLAELRQTIDLRRTRGAAPALAVVLSDQGKQVMDEILTLCAQIRRGEIASQGQASAQGEAAAQTALLVTVAGSIVLLLFFAVGFEPFMERGIALRERPWWLRYGAAVVATTAAILLRLGLAPLVAGSHSVVPFITFFPAVLFVAWYGGFRAGAFTILLSALAAYYFFLEPAFSLRVSTPGDLVTLFIYVLVSFGIALMSESQRRAIARGDRAEDAEREQRQRFETTLASIGDAVIATDTGGRVTFANKIAVSLVKWPEAEMLGKELGEVFRIVDASTRAPVESPVARVLREGSIVGLANHTTLIARDGTELPIDDSAAPIRDARCEILGVVLVFRDISGRRATQRLLAEQASELRRRSQMMESVTCFVRDLEDRIVYWNPGAAELYGFSETEALGQISHSLLQTRFPAPLDAIRSQLMQTGQWNGELGHTRRDGTCVKVASYWALHRDLEGRVLSTLEVNVDITQRKQAEERFQLAVEATPNGMVLVNEQGEIVLVNSYAEKLFGYSSEEMIGQGVEILVPGRFRASHPAYRRDFAGQPQARSMGTGRDLYGRRKDGSEFPIEIGLNPIKTDRELLVLSSIVDITERKRLEEQRLELMAKDRALASESALREAEAEVARVARAMSVGEMATSIAHEINQPLASVVTNAEAGLRWLSREAPNVKEAKESLALITRDGNRASAVIRRIREFLQKGLQETASLDINGVVEEAVALARAELQKRRIAPRMELSSDLPRVSGDRIQLQQVVLNLIMNGAEAMDSAEGKKELLVKSQKSAGGGVLVAVRDSGPGISPEALPRMFDAFFTTKPAGMGMGLSISRTIVEAHGGRIWAALNEGPGITAQFALPAEASRDRASKRHENAMESGA